MSSNDDYLPELDLTGFNFDPTLSSSRAGTPSLAQLPHIDFNDLEGHVSPVDVDDLEAMLWGRASSPAPSTAPSSTSSSAAKSGLPAIACNNKRALDAKWDHLNTLSTSDLNRYLRQHPELSVEDVAAIKQARRRAKSRVYSKTAREKRTQAPSPSNGSVMCELQTLRAQLADARAHVAMLSTLAAIHGICVPEEL
jgi:hypothetical protein